MALIGIDLGTTNSLVAYWGQDGPEIIRNVHGSTLTPSVVSVDDNDEILVGQTAKERLITHPSRTAASFKRYMGTEKLYNLGRFTFTPEELSSLVLRSLKADAEAYLGQGIDEAVVSVPAYFSDAQRKATKRAAELAGLKVERLVNEPTAAALSYGLHLNRDINRFLVFDLGGGTFDVSILELFENVMEVKSVAGDNHLGGDDFTAVLAKEFLARSGIPADKLDLKTTSAVYRHAERLKFALSDTASGNMAVTFQEKEYSLEIDRRAFESLSRELIERLRLPVERALHDASLSPRDLSAVALVGGATRMPMVRMAVSRMFGQLPRAGVNPDEAVALGAAVQAALKSRNQTLGEVVLTDVCPYTLGVVTTKVMGYNNFETGYFLPIIERNTSIPVSRVESVQTLHDNQRQLNIEIYQGESMMVKNDIRLGEFLVDVPPGPAGKETAYIRFTYDINGILEVEATVPSTGLTRGIVIEKNPGSMSEQQLQARLEAMKTLKIHPREREENRLLLARAERLYEELRGEDRERVMDAMISFKRALETQDEKTAAQAAQVFGPFLDRFECEV